MGSAHALDDDGPEGDTPVQVVLVQEVSLSGSANPLPPGKQWFQSAPEGPRFPYESIQQMNNMSAALIEWASRRYPVPYAPAPYYFLPRDSEFGS